MAELFGEDISRLRTLTPQQLEVYGRMEALGTRRRAGVTEGVTGKDIEEARELTGELPSLAEAGLQVGRNVQLARTGVGARGLTTRQRYFGAAATPFQQLTQTIAQERGQAPTVPVAAPTVAQARESGTGVEAADFGPASLYEAGVEAFGRAGAGYGIGRGDIFGPALGAGAMLAAGAPVGAAVRGALPGPLGWVQTLADVAVASRSAGRLGTAAGEQLSAAYGTEPGRVGPTRAAAGLMEAARGLQATQEVTPEMMAHPATTPEETARRSAVTALEEKAVPTTLMGQLGYGLRRGLGYLGIGRQRTIEDIFGEADPAGFGEAPAAISTAQAAAYGNPLGYSEVGLGLRSVMGAEFGERQAARDLEAQLRAQAELETSDIGTTGAVGGWEPAGRRGGYYNPETGGYVTSGYARTAGITGIDPVTGELMDAYGRTASQREAERQAAEAEAARQAAEAARRQAEREARSRGWHTSEGGGYTGSGRGTGGGRGGEHETESDPSGGRGGV